MASGVLLQSLGNGTLWDQLGNALNNHSVFVYLRGTTTQVQVYTDAGLTTPFTQPLLTGASGAGPGGIPGYVTGGWSLDFLDVTTGARTQAEPLLADLVGNLPVVRLDSYYDSPAYANKTAAIQAAYAAAVAGRAVLECQAKRVYLLDTGPLQLATAAPIVIEGRRATFRANWGKPRCIDFVRTADYQTFNDIEIRDLICDANGLTSGSNQSIIGNQIDGGGNQRVNAARIALRRVTTLNVPTGASGAASYQNFALLSTHLASNEATQTTLTDVVVEDCDFSHGGNTGVFISGTGTYTAGLGVNVFMDRIFIGRTRHDTLVTPTQFVVGANFQVGGVGFGDRCTLVDCYGANAGDVGIEIDGMQTVLKERCEMVDSWTAKYLTRNFRAPVSLGTQKNTMRDCVASTVNLDRTLAGANSTDFYLTGDGSTAGYIFGEQVIENCSSITTTTLPAPQTSGLAVLATGCQFRKLTIRNLNVGLTNLAITGNNNTVVPIDIRSLMAGSIYDIKGVYFRMDGVRSNAIGPANQWKIMRVEGAADFRLTLDGFYIDTAGLTGIAAGGTSDVFYWVILAPDHASTGRISINDVRAVSVPSGGGHHGIYQGGSLSLTGKMRVRGCDFAQLPSGSGVDYNVQSSLKANTLITDILTARTQASGSGPLQTTTTISVTASAFAYQNLDSVHEIVTIAGGTVSAVTIQPIGGGATIAQAIAGDFYLAPGDTITVTYTVAPTMTKRPTWT